MTSSISSATATSPVLVPESATCAATLSPEERLLALVVYNQVSQMDSARTSVDVNSEKLQRLREQVQKALDDARNAEKHSGFWGGLAKLFGSDIASIASAVAAAAAVVATGGAAVAVIAAVAAAASIAAEHAKELGIPPEVAMVIAVTASVAALCCGDGAGLFKVTDAVKSTANQVKLWATVGADVATATGGACEIEGAGYARDAGYDHADARQAEGQQQTVSSDIDDALERFAAALERQNDAAKLVSDIQAQSDSSSVAILNSWGGAA